MTLATTVGFDPGALRMIGWTLAHTLWLGAIVAGGLYVAYRVVPAVRARLRFHLALGSLALLVGAAGLVGTSLLSGWRVHAGCWELVGRSATAGLTLPAGCRPHVGDAAEKLSAAFAPLATPRHSGIRSTSPPVPAAEGMFGISAGARASVLERTLARASRASGISDGLRGARGLFVRASVPLGWAAAAWALVVAALLARFCATLWATRRLVGQSRPLTDPVVREALARAKERIDPGRPVAMRQVLDLDSPALVGWRQPVVLVPERVLEHLSARELEPILVHELVHAARSDYAVNAVQHVLDILLFFNPFHLWISRKVRQEREAARDREVVDRGRVPTQEYVRGLLAAEARRDSRRPGSAAALYHGHGGLLDRARRLASPNRRRGGWRSRHLRLWAFPALLAGSLAAGALATTTAYEGTSLSSFAVMTVDLQTRVAVPASDPARLHSSTP